MVAVKDSFVDLERHRLELEQDVAKLGKALDHWRRWDAEYEGLKEEVLSLARTSSTSSTESSGNGIARIRQTFRSDLILENELDEIFGRAQQKKQQDGKQYKSPEQICNVLERRMDYVARNIETLEKQLGTAEGKLAAATVLSDPGMVDEDGLPITDILEELDEEGNVVNSQLRRAGDKGPQMMEAIQKVVGTMAGTVEEETTEKKEPEKLQAPVTSYAQRLPGQHASQQEEKAPTPPAQKSTPSDNEPAKKAQPQPLPEKLPSEEEIYENAIALNKPLESIAIPADDDSEGASKLLADIAEYQASTAHDVSQVSGDMKELVAIFQDLEDPDTSDYETMDEEDEDEDDDDDDDEYAADDDDDEDSFGRTTDRAIIRKLEQRMIEVKKRLGLDWQTSTPRVPAEDDDDGDSIDDDAGGNLGRIVVEKPPEAEAEAKAPEAPSKPSALKSSKSGGKKSVRFAQELDIASEQVAKPTSKPAPAPKVERPIRDIVERSAPAAPVKETVPKKTSRFKKSKQQQPPEAGILKTRHSVPAVTESQQLVEKDDEPRMVVKNTIVTRDEASTPRDYEDVAEQQAIAEEYHRQRRVMINKAGGFLQEDESPIRPVDDDLAPRVSRFKAARLSKQ